MRLGAVKTAALLGIPADEAEAYAAEHGLTDNEERPAEAGTMAEDKRGGKNA